MVRDQWPGSQASANAHGDGKVRAGNCVLIVRGQSPTSDRRKLNVEDEKIRVQKGGEVDSTSEVTRKEV